VNIVSGCQPDESNPALSYAFYQCSILNQRRKPMWVWRVVRLVTSDSFPVSVKTIIQKQRIIQWCNGCSLRLDLLILFLNLFPFSTLVSAFQFFTRKYCLQFSGLNLCSFTLTWNRFLIKKNADRSTCVALLRLVTRIQITANLNHCKVRKAEPVT